MIRIQHAAYSHRMQSIQLQTIQVAVQRETNWRSKETIFLLMYLILGWNDGNAVSCEPCAREHSLALCMNHMCDVVSMYCSS